MSVFFECFAVYKHPRDFPEKFVVRRWTYDGIKEVPEDPPIIVCDSLREARAAVPKGTINSGRESADDPVIVEVWL